MAKNIILNQHILQFFAIDFVIKYCFFNFSNLNLIVEGSKARLNGMREDNNSGNKGSIFDVY